jgi:hypothetical protein
MAAPCHVSLAVLFAASISATNWKDSPNGWFQGFSLFPVRCYCWGPRHLICSASLGRFALSGEIEGGAEECIGKDRERK